MKAPQLRPEDGALNTIVAEQTVLDANDITTRGKATMLAAAHLARDVGAALLSMSMEHSGTLEFQLTVNKVRTKLPEGSAVVHQWRVDVWKTRQRQYLRVPVRRMEPGALTEGTRPPEITLPDGTVLGLFHCPNCGEQRQRPPVDIGRLPRRTAEPCGRCSLPIFIQLVEAK